MCLFSIHLYLLLVKLEFVTFTKFIQNTKLATRMGLKLSTDMAVYGNIGSFDENVESFEDYADRMDAFLLANEIHADRQASLFLASVGPSAYKLLKNLCSPAQPST